MNDFDSSLETLASEGGFSIAVAAGAIALAATVVGNASFARQAYTTGLNKGAKPHELAEVARMAHLFAGFPRSIAGIQAFSQACTDAAQPVPDDEEPVLDRTTQRARGLRLFERIYAEQAPVVLGNMAQLLPGFDEIVLQHAYGRIFSRPGLQAKDRELVAIAALIVLDCPSQLVSHTLGALRLGVTAPAIRAMLSVVALLPYDIEAARGVVAPLLRGNSSDR